MSHEDECVSKLVDKIEVILDKENYVSSLMAITYIFTCMLKGLYKKFEKEEGHLLISDILANIKMIVEAAK